ncbi:unnamed protein product [marine sediment metagenome]|uniref:Uncharacterized protein n=1 Tax=marine sediment metagenome TaxID=412755 RepID=X0ZR72_9ZZZZ
MAVKSAKSGTAAWDGALDDVTDISVTLVSDVKEYASSSTGGRKSRRAGHSDATGSFTMKADAFAFDEGDSGVLVLTSDGAVELFNGTAMIIDISYSVPVESGDNIECVVTWGQMPT